MPAELMDSEVLLSSDGSSDIFIMLKRCRDLVQPRNSCVNLLIMSLMLPFLTFYSGDFHSEQCTRIHSNYNHSLI